jgi:hypothetical protein
MEFRRRVPRQEAGWIGLCHIEGEPADEPRECLVLDVSEFGVGIQLVHPLGVELLGRHIAVETPSAAESVNIRLEGEVRNAISVNKVSVRLGIEFDELTALEESVVKALGVLNALQ